MTNEVDDSVYAPASVADAEDRDYISTVGKTVPCEPVMRDDIEAINIQEIQTTYVGGKQIEVEVAELANVETERIMSVKQAEKEELTKRKQQIVEDSDATTWPGDRLDEHISVVETNVTVTEEQTPEELLLQEEVGKSEQQEESVEQTQPAQTQDDVLQVTETVTVGTIGTTEVQELIDFSTAAETEIVTDEATPETEPCVLQPQEEKIPHEEPSTVSQYEMVTNVEETTTVTEAEILIVTETTEVDSYKPVNKEDAEEIFATLEAEQEAEVEEREEIAEKSAAVEHAEEKVIAFEAEAPETAAVMETEPELIAEEVTLVEKTAKKIKPGEIVEEPLVEESAEEHVTITKITTVTVVKETEALPTEHADISEEILLAADIEETLEDAVKTFEQTPVAETEAETLKADEMIKMALEEAKTITVDEAREKAVKYELEMKEAIEESSVEAVEEAVHEDEFPITVSGKQEEGEKQYVTETRGAVERIALNELSEEMLTAKETLGEEVHVAEDVTADMFVTETERVTDEATVRAEPCDAQPAEELEEKTEHEITKELLRVSQEKVITKVEETTMITETEVLVVTVAAEVDSYKPVSKENVDNVFAQQEQRDKIAEEPAAIQHAEEEVKPSELEATETAAVMETEPELVAEEVTLVEKTVKKIKPGEIVEEPLAEESPEEHLTITKITTVNAAKETEVLTSEHKEILEAIRLEADSESTLEEAVPITDTEVKDLEVQGIIEMTPEDLAKKHVVEAEGAITLFTEEADAATTDDFGAMLQVQRESEEEAKKDAMKTKVIGVQQTLLKETEEKTMAAEKSVSEEVQVADEITKKPVPVNHEEMITEVEETTTVTETEVVVVTLAAEVDSYKPVSKEDVEDVSAQQKQHDEIAEELAAIEHAEEEVKPSEVEATETTEVMETEPELVAEEVTLVERKAKKIKPGEIAEEPSVEESAEERLTITEITTLAAAQTIELLNSEHKEKSEKILPTSDIEREVKKEVKAVEQMLVETHKESVKEEAPAAEKISEEPLPVSLEEIVTKVEEKTTITETEILVVTVASEVDFYEPVNKEDADDVSAHQETKLEQRYEMAKEEEKMTETEATEVAGLMETESKLIAEKVTLTEKTARKMKPGEIAKEPLVEEFAEEHRTISEITTVAAAKETEVPTCEHENISEEIPLATDIEEEIQEEMESVEQMSVETCTEKVSKKAQAAEKISEEPLLVSFEENVTEVEETTTITETDIVVVTVASEVDSYKPVSKEDAEDVFAQQETELEQRDEMADKEREMNETEATKLVEIVETEPKFIADKVTLVERTAKKIKPGEIVEEPSGEESAEKRLTITEVTTIAAAKETEITISEQKDISEEISPVTDTKETLEEVTKTTEHALAADTKEKELEVEEIIEVTPEELAKKQKVEPEEAVDVSTAEEVAAITYEEGVVLQVQKELEEEAKEDAIETEVDGEQQILLKEAEEETMTAKTTVSEELQVAGEITEKPVPVSHEKMITEVEEITTVTEADVVVVTVSAEVDSYKPVSKEDVEDVFTEQETEVVQRDVIAEKLAAAEHAAEKVELSETQASVIKIEPELIAEEVTLVEKTAKKIKPVEIVEDPPVEKSAEEQITITEITTVTAARESKTTITEHEIISAEILPAVDTEGELKEAVETVAETNDKALAAEAVVKVTTEELAEAYEVEPKEAVEVSSAEEEVLLRVQEEKENTVESAVVVEQVLLKGTGEEFETDKESLSEEPQVREHLLTRDEKTVTKIEETTTITETEIVVVTIASEVDSYKPVSKEDVGDVSAQEEAEKDQRGEMAEEPARVEHAEEEKEMSTVKATEAAEVMKTEADDIADEPVLVDTKLQKIELQDIVRVPEVEQSSKEDAIVTEITRDTVTKEVEEISQKNIAVPPEAEVQQAEPQTEVIEDIIDRVSRDRKMENLPIFDRELAAEAVSDEQEDQEIVTFISMEEEVEPSEIADDEVELIKPVLSETQVEVDETVSKSAAVKKDVALDAYLSQLEPPIAATAKDDVAAPPETELIETEPEIEITKAVIGIVSHERKVGDIPLHETDLAAKTAPDEQEDRQMVATISTEEEIKPGEIANEEVELIEPETQLSETQVEVEEVELRLAVAKREVALNARLSQLEPAVAAAAVLETETAVEEKTELIQESTADQVEKTLEQAETLLPTHVEDTESLTRELEEKDESTAVAVTLAKDVSTKQKLSQETAADDTEILHSISEKIETVELHSETNETWTQSTVASKITTRKARIEERKEATETFSEEPLVLHAPEAESSVSEEVHDDSIKAVAGEQISDEELESDLELLLEESRIKYDISRTDASDPLLELLPQDIREETTLEYVTSPDKVVFKDEVKKVEEEKEAENTEGDFPAAVGVEMTEIPDKKIQAETKTDTISADLHAVSSGVVEELMLKVSQQTLMDDTGIVYPKTLCSETETFEPTDAEPTEYQPFAKTATKEEDVRKEEKLEAEGVAVDELSTSEEMVENDYTSDASIVMQLQAEEVQVEEAQPSSVEPSAMRSEPDKTVYPRDVVESSDASLVTAEQTDETFIQRDDKTLPDETVEVVDVPDVDRTPLESAHPADLAASSADDIQDAIHDVAASLVITIVKAAGESESAGKSSPGDIEVEKSSRDVSVPQTLVTEADRSTVMQVVRSVRSDGEIVEQVVSMDSASALEALGALPSPQTSLCAGESGEETETTAVVVYADTVEERPDSETEMTEYEEYLPDGTLVRRKVIKTTRHEAVTRRVVVEETSTSATEQHDDQQILSTQSEEQSTPAFLRYSDRVEEGPLTVTLRDDTSYDTLSDGRSVVTHSTVTSQQKLVMERTFVDVVEEWQQADLETVDNLLSAEPTGTLLNFDSQYILVL